MSLPCGGNQLFYMQRCQTVLGPFKVSGSGAEAKPGSCPGCQMEDTFKIDQEQTMYRNYQKITLQVKDEGWNGEVLWALQRERGGGRGGGGDN